MGIISVSLRKNALNILNKIFTKHYLQRFLHKRRCILAVHKAFTLAEVLVTLAIIGVVAALTIPTLMSSIENAGTASRVKKANSMLNQAIKMYMVDNDCIGDLAACGGFSGGADGSGNGQAWNAIKPYFKIIKDCGTKTGQGCFSTGTYYKLLNGNNYMYLDHLDRGKGILSDGFSILIENRDNCSADFSSTGQTALKQTCANIFIDTNAIKGPNKIGRDVFSFRVTKSGVVYPSGSLDDSEYSSSEVPKCDPAATGHSLSAGGGHGCAARIIREGKVNY